MAQSWPFLKADAAASSGACEPAIGSALLQQGLTLGKDGNLSALVLVSGSQGPSRLPTAVQFLYLVVLWKKLGVRLT